MLHEAERHNAKKRKAILVHNDVDNHADAQPSAEQLAIAADTECRIADACEGMNMSPEQTLALLVVLHTLSRPKYRDWIDAHPVEWRMWLDASEMTPERVSQITPDDARKLFIRLLTTLRNADE
jgi:hypothetical protein